MILQADALNMPLADCSVAYHESQPRQMEIGV